MKVCDLRWGWFDIVKIKKNWLMLGIGIGNNLIIRGTYETYSAIARLFTHISKKNHYLIFGKKYFYIHSPKPAAIFVFLLGV